jgi:O-antigen ligase
VFLVFRPHRVGWKGVASAVLAMVVIAAAAFVVDPSGGLNRFDRSMAKDERFQAAPRIVEAASAYAPVGSGLGTFEAVYRSVERPERVTNEFLNHAHDDYLELWLETGALGAVALLGFLAWFLRAGGGAWSRKSGGGAERDLARAGAVVVAVMMLHSLVDYPLRTTSLAVLFAFACGLLVSPPPEAARERVRVREKARA